jgi:hypothetical protein
MQPVGFKEANVQYGEGDSEIVACALSNQVITCWKMTFIERIVAFITGRVWLSVGGEVIPPVGVSVKRPFVKVEEVKDGDT